MDVCVAELSGTYGTAVFISTEFLVGLRAHDELQRSTGHDLIVCQESLLIRFSIEFGRLDENVLATVVVSNDGKLFP